jgi:hypothetical protein
LSASSIIIYEARGLLFAVSIAAAYYSAGSEFYIRREELTVGRGAM